MQSQLEPTRSHQGVYIVVDFSNILFGLRRMAAARGEDPGLLRIDPGRLLSVLAAGRRVTSATIALPVWYSHAVVRHFARYFRVIRVDVGRATGTEIGGDEVLQAPFLFEVAAEVMNGTAAGTLVLVTGDGAGSLVGRGNIPLIRFARHNGLGVEVVAITFTLNRRLAAVAQVMGSLEFLDPYYDAITYTDQRSATSIDDRARRTERAHPWSPVEDAQIKLVLASPDYDHVLRAAIAVRVAEPDRRLIAKLLAVFGTYLASGLGPEEAAARAEGDDTMTLAERVRALLALRIVNDAMNVPQG